MKLYVPIVFALQLLLLLALCAGQKYSSRYDHLNIDMILSNKRVLSNYVKCILDEGPCTAEGRELRTHIPEALRTNCAKCTDAQRKFVRRGAEYLFKNHPQEWAKISNKYDPQGKYANEFRQFLSV